MSRRHPRRSLDGERFDIVVIGGGINGVAIARECAHAGRRVLLVEQHDFASGTTSRSTRIIHGGLRYLEHGEIGLVRESLRERQRLLGERPHLVRPLQFALALHEGAQRSALEIRLGLWLYRKFAGGLALSRPRGNALAELERLLDSGRQWTVFDYEDAQCEFPERLVAEWLGEAAAAGATARNYVEALAIETLAGRVRAVRLRDGFTGDEARVEAGWIVNAAGPWVDRICGRSRIYTPQPLVGGVRGSHLVLSRFAGAPSSAIYTEAPDGRPVFVVPWNGQVLVGTTEVRDDDPACSQPSAEEVRYLFRSVQQLFPRAGIVWDHVRCALAGVRPLPYAPAQLPAAVTRKHILRDHAGDGAAGMISVIGGKLTTAASLARECARIAGLHVAEPPPCTITAVPAGSVESALCEWADMIASQSGISMDSARGIAEWHGRRAPAIASLARSCDELRAPLCRHSHHLVAEAIEAVRNEGAVTLGDILLRRVPVALGVCWSDACSVTAARRIGRALGWRETELRTELESFEEERAAFLRKVSPPLEAVRMPPQAARNPGDHIRYG